MSDENAEGQEYLLVMISRKNGRRVQKSLDSEQAAIEWAVKIYQQRKREGNWSVFIYQENTDNPKHAGSFSNGELSLRSLQNEDK